MAQRRTFSREITETDEFLDMPLSAQCLYFHLNIRVDDKSLIKNAKAITRGIGASEDDLKLLLEKQYLMEFADGVVAIKEWRNSSHAKGVK